MALLNSKPANAKLGLAVHLMLYRATGRFGRAASEFADAAVAYRAEQIGAPIADFTAYDSRVASSATLLTQHRGHFTFPKLAVFEL